MTAQQLAHLKTQWAEIRRHMTWIRWCLGLTLVGQGMLLPRLVWRWL